MNPSAEAAAAATGCIPPNLREAITQRTGGRDLLAMLDRLEAGNPNVSRGHIETDWELFKEGLRHNHEEDAVMLITVLACICRYRPKMFDKLMPDAYEPLYALDIRYPNEILEWYVSRDTLDAGVKQWLRDTLPARFNWLQGAEGPETERDDALSLLLADAHASDIAAAPKELTLTNYNVVTAKSLFVFLLLGIGMLPVILSGHIGALWLSVPFLLMALLVGFSLTREVASIHLADGVTVQRMMQLPLEYRLVELRHIHLRSVKTRLYWLLSVYQHMFVDFEMRDGREFSVRLGREEGSKLARFLTARGFASRMERVPSRQGMLPILYFSPSAE